MENIVIYLIKSSALLALFFSAYHFLLCRETFFKSNRWFLLSGLATSALLPLITFQKIIWVTAKRENLAWTNIPVSNSAVESFHVNWVFIIAIFYFIGLSAFLIQFLFDYIQLLKILRGKIVKIQSDFKLVDVNEHVAPFSYFGYIVYNSSLYTQPELENILEHEKVHCAQRHSIDVLVSRIFCIVFWMNPFVWIYKRAMLQNLEFIADGDALKIVGNRSSYQLTLLKITTHQHHIEISNHFYQSLIKKRIVMLNKNQSKNWKSWKYALIIPALAAFMFYFQMKVIAQEKALPVAEKTASDTSFILTKNMTDAEMKRGVEMLQQNGIEVKFSKIKRNKSGEIVAVKAIYDDKFGNKGTHQVSGDEPIQPIRIFRNRGGEVGFSNGLGLKDIADTLDRVKNVSDDWAPESPNAAESPEAPETPQSPQPPVKMNSKIKITHDDNGKMTISINGETVDVDSEKILADIEPMLDEFENMKIDLDVNNADWSPKDAMRQAQSQMKNARTEAERAKSNTERQRIRRRQADVDLKQSRTEMEQARKELEQSLKELEQSRAEIEKLRTAAKKRN